MLLKSGIAVLIALILGPVVCFLASGITMGTDGTQADTVGTISRNGFPIWFRETAPGYSVVDGWHENRFEADLAFWIVVFFVTALVALRLADSAVIKQRRNK